MSQPTPEQSSNAPVVPDQLTPYLSEPHIHEVVERWQRGTLDEVKKRINEPRLLDLGARAVHVVILGPTNDEYDPAQTVFLGLAPHETWRPGTYVRAAMLREIVVPNGRLVVVPGSEKDGRPSYELSNEDRNKLKAGDSTPLAELQMRALENQGIGRVAMTGYGLGGLMVLNAARQSTESIETTHLNLDEIPLGGFRDTARLRRDIEQSESNDDHKKAVADSAMPLFEESKQGDRKGLRLNRFKQSSHPDQQLLQALARSPENSLIDAMFQQRGVRIKLGRVAGSKLVSPVFFEAAGQYPGLSNIRVQEYTGEGAHGHATGDNPVAHALMAYDGIGRLG